MSGLGEAIAPLESELSPGDSVEWLVDNAKTYDAVLRAIGSARDSIWISQLAFDADCVAHGERAADATSLLGAIIDGSRRSATRRTHSGEREPSARHRDGVAARHACHARRRVTSKVRGIQSISAVAAREAADRRRTGGVRARLTFREWILGLTSGHRPVDARRPMRELGGRPLHDLSMRVTGLGGPRTRRYLRRVVERRSAKAECAGPSASGHACAAVSGTQVPGNSMRAISTVPRGVLPRSPRRDATEILSAMERGIRRARSLLYIEHQYLRARASWCAHSSRRWRARRRFEVIVVLNQNPDVTAHHRGWQNARLSEAGTSLTSACRFLCAVVGGDAATLVS